MDRNEGTRGIRRGFYCIFFDTAAGIVTLF